MWFAVIEFEITLTPPLLESLLVLDIARVGSLNPFKIVAAEIHRVIIFVEYYLGT